MLSSVSCAEVTCCRHREKKVKNAQKKKKRGKRRRTRRRRTMSIAAELLSTECDVGEVTDCAFCGNNTTA
jgi:hypothetical protein